MRSFTSVGDEITGSGKSMMPIFFSAGVTAIARIADLLYCENARLVDDAAVLELDAI
jgi:hypothetical protein